ncbi:hypothetical protein [Persephonella sp.]
MKHLHDYKIIKQTTNGMLEVCRICKKRLLTNISIWGTSDNRTYAKEHERDFLQPNSKIFEKEYGKVQNLQKRNKK